MTKVAFRGGDMVAVDWVDTATNPTGNPETAAVEPRRTLGYFRGVKTQSLQHEESKAKVRRKMLVVSDTHDMTQGQEGWTAIPLPNVMAVTELVLTKKRWMP